MTRLAVVTSLACLLGACSSDSSSAPIKGVESELPADGKFDSSNGIVEHTSAIQEISEIGVSFTDSARGHAFGFTLGMDEEVSITTALMSGDRGPQVDTVLYLYKLGDAGWGRYIRRNDDDAEREGTTWSRIDADLGPGEYRILVKAYDATVNGDFAVNMVCADGLCDYTVPGDPEPDLGTGTADQGGTSTVSVALPILDDSEYQLLSRFNSALTAADLPTFPDTLTISNKSDVWVAKFDALVLQAQREDVLAITDGELERFSSLETLVAGGFCYRGQATALPDLLTYLPDSVLSDQFVLQGWRAGRKSAYEQWHEPTSAAEFYDAWNDFDTTGTDVLIVASDDDDGTPRVALVPLCD